MMKIIYNVIELPLDDPSTIFYRDIKKEKKIQSRHAQVGLPGKNAITCKMSYLTVSEMKTMLQLV